MGSVTEEN